MISTSPAPDSSSVAQPQALAVAEADERDVHSAAGVVAAAPRDVRAHPRRRARSRSAQRTSALRAPAPAGRHPRIRRPRPFRRRRALHLADVERGPLVHQRPVLAVARQPGRPSRCASCGRRGSRGCSAAKRWTSTSPARRVAGEPASSGGPFFGASSSGACAALARRVVRNTRCATPRNVSVP